MAKIIFVSKWKSRFGQTIYEVYYDSDRWYQFCNENDVPKTVRNFMANATSVASIWNSTRNRREIVYKENTNG